MDGFGAETQMVRAHMEPRLRYEIARSDWSTCVLRSTESATELDRSCIKSILFCRRCVTVIARIEKKGAAQMDFPWKEQATLVRMAAVEQPDDQSCELLFEGPLLLLAVKVRAMKEHDRRRLRLSLPNRQIRPHTFRGPDLEALIEAIPHRA